MPSRNDDGEWWTMLTSAGLWEGADDLQVFCEFVDIMFQTLTAGHIEWDMRPLFADRRDEKINCCTRAITMLGEEMERHPFCDRLGDYHQELSGPGHKAALGSFYTPESLCKVCAGITIDVDEAKAKAARGETVTICDPACGSGRLPLAVAEMLADVRHDLRITCTDIELLACKMAYINLAMWDVPATIIHGDSLQGKEWGVWKTPALIRIELAEDGIEKWRSLMRLFGQHGADECPEVETMPEVPSPSVQLELNF